MSAAPTTCPACGGALLERYVAAEGRHGWLHDGERLALVCEACGDVVEATP